MGTNTKQPNQTPKRNTFLLSFTSLRRIENISITVLCKSNASEMREFRSLFMRTFQESSRESSSDNSRPLERNFPGTKNDISSNFRYETKFLDDKRRFTNSVPEISR